MATQRSQPGVTGSPGSVAERGARGWNTWKTRQLRAVHAAKGANASRAQTTAMVAFRFGATDRVWFRGQKSRAGARAIATSAPSGRRSAAKVTASVKVSAKRPGDPLLKSHCRPESERDGKESRTLGERIGGIDRGKGAKDCEPERGVCRTGYVARRRNATGNVGEQQTAGKLHCNLQGDDGCVVPYPEEFEAGGKKERIARQADKS